MTGTGTGEGAGVVVVAWVYALGSGVGLEKGRDKMRYDVSGVITLSVRVTGQHNHTNTIETGT